LGLTSADPCRCGLCRGWWGASLKNQDPGLSVGVWPWTAVGTLGGRGGGKKVQSGRQAQGNADGQSWFQALAIYKRKKRGTWPRLSLAPMLNTYRDRYWHLGGRQRVTQMLGNLIDPVDFPELLQKLRVTIVEAHDLPELRPETRFVLYNFPPDFDLAEQ